MPENVIVDVVIVTKKDGGLLHRVIAEQLTAEYDDLGLKCERDAFDTLFDHAPDKLQVLFFQMPLHQNTHIILAMILQNVSNFMISIISGGQKVPGNFCQQTLKQNQP